MGRKRPPGLVKRGKIWHIDKEIRKFGRLCETTGESSLSAAEDYLENRIASIKKQLLSGRPDRTWQDAAIKHLRDNQDKASIIDDAYHLKALDPFIGRLKIEQVHDDSLRPFVEAQRKKGLKTKTINLELGVVRKILNTCAGSWRYESGRTWLDAAPRITMQRPPGGRSDTKKPYPLDWDEQDRFFQLLPDHVARMALFKVNTGNRQAEVCGLKWEWEWTTAIPELEGRVFIIPGDAELPNEKGVKNRQDRLIMLNDIAKSVIDSVRGIDPVYVFTCKGKPMARMNNSAWRRAWTKAGLPVGEGYLKGVHNLKHTFGRRLRAAGVALETRKVLLGHKNGDITTHYSVPEISELLRAASSVCSRSSRKTPALAIVRLKVANG